MLPKAKDKRIKILQDAADFLVKNKIIQQTVDVSKWFDGSYYEKAKRELA